MPFICRPRTFHLATASAVFLAAAAVASAADRSGGNTSPAAARGYEYLVMLRRRLAAATRSGETSPAAVRAQRLLAEGPDRVLAGASVRGYRWDEPKDRARADRVRLEMLEALLALAADGPD